MGCGPSSAALYAAKEEATALRADLRGARGAEAEARGREGLARDAERRALRAAADQVRCASLLPAAFACFQEARLPAFACLPAFRAAARALVADQRHGASRSSRGHA